MYLQFVCGGEVVRLSSNESLVRDSDHLLCEDKVLPEGAEVVLTDVNDAKGQPKVLVVTGEPIYHVVTQLNRKILVARLPVKIKPPSNKSD